LIDQGLGAAPQKPPVRIETDPSQDREAALDLSAGAGPMPVLFTLQQVEGEIVGYLRLAHGHGHFANRLLGSAGLRGKLALPSGLTRAVIITSTDPGEAPGYLCAFSFAAETE